MSADHNISEDNQLMQGIDGLLDEYLHTTIAVQDDSNGFLQVVAIVILCAAGVFMLVSFIALLVNVAGILFPKQPYQRDNCKKKAFKSWALSTLMAGYVLYFIGFYFEGTRNSFLAYLFRPLLSSLEMFVSHSDLIEVDTFCKHNPYYMAAFSLVHFSAVAVSASFAINCFWKRIVFWLRRKWWMLCPTRGTVNVFFGLNDRGIILSNNLHDTAASSRKERMLFIDMPDEGHKSAQRLSFSHIFGLFSYKSDQVRAISRLHPLLMHSAMLPSQVENADENVLDVLELRSVRKIISRASEVRLYFLSQSEENNIKATLNVLCDRIFKKQCPKVYCRARYNVINTSVYGLSKAEVKLVDESSLSVTALKLMSQGGDMDEVVVPLEYPAHPILFVDTDPYLGCVKSKFVSLIIGCGDTGQDALRFVYEFGAFCGVNGKKSPFKCYVMDERMEDKKGNLFREIPALPALSDEIVLLDMKAGSLLFWEKLKVIVNSLNYVVIALGNDEANITLAAELCEFAARYRQGGLDKFGIFVRSYDAVNETRLKRTADYYAKPGRGVIYVFGTLRDIYSREMIVGDGRLIWMAERFYENYQRVMSEGECMDWKERHASAIEGKVGEELALSKQGLYRKEFQDIENGIHRYTKRELAGNALCYDDIPHPRDMKFNLDISVMEPAEAIRYRCLINLSIGEHLRWNASHYMLGYVPMPAEEQKRTSVSCSERKKEHKYLVSWEQLSDETKMYDYAVVYTTFTADVQKNH